MNKEAIINRLMKEDKSGLAYCLNQMLGEKSFGYIHLTCSTKKELREKIPHLTDAELLRLKDFRTYKDLF